MSLKEMMSEKIIEEDYLKDHIYDCIKLVTEENYTLLVHPSTSNDQNQYSFVIGPENVCGLVLGLYDEEYGWPLSIQIHEINSIRDIKPGYRKHPFIIDSNKHIAISIQCSEYKYIKEKHFKNG